MAAPDTDYLLALRLQLQENGAGDLSAVDMLGLDTHPHTTPETLQSRALAQSLEASDQLVISDCKFARKLAASQHGLKPDDRCAEPQPDELLQQHQRTVQCQICFDEFLPHLAFASNDCKHRFCFPCFVQYMRLVIQRGHPYPVTCPSCRTVLDNQTCLKALSGTGDDYEALERLIINKDYTNKIRYCANTKCAMPFDWVIDDAGAQNVEQIARVLCPLCNTETCAICRCVWHENETCEEHAVRQDLESLSLLAELHKWIRCPDCGHLIEKRDGDCNFVRCKCGCGFCHSCGTAYMTLEATTDNVHGMPGCRCSLFPPVEAELPQQAQQQPRQRQAQQQQQLQQYEPEPLVMMPPLYQGVAGPNGHINVMKCLEGDQREMGGPLPQAMMMCLSQNVCPYEDCDIHFQSVRSLEQHLAFVQRHKVYLCCERPFYHYASLRNHQVNNHGHLHVPV